MIGGDSSRYQAWTDCSSLSFDGEAVQTAEKWMVALLLCRSSAKEESKHMCVLNLPPLGDILGYGQGQLLVEWSCQHRVWT